MRPSLAAACFLAVSALCATPSVGHARSPEDCQLAWGQASRSYLTGKQGGPQDTDFKAACDMDAKGEKDNARVEAVVVASGALAKVSTDVCERFLKSYVGVGEPSGVCAAAGGGDDAAFRKAVTDALPPPGKGAAKGKKKG
jgi:hypothetical protein